MQQERRIGRRWEAPELDVDWNVGATRSTWRGRRREEPQAGRVIDVSVSGASILARTDERLMGGSRIVIGYDRETSLAVIRRISRPDRGPRVDEQSVYGVEFIDAPAHMVSNLMESVVGGDDEALEHRWNRSV